MENNYEEKTQKYSTWGDKLLYHADVLNSIQNKKKFIPITIQLAPCEVCDSDCPFCSVAERPLRSHMPFEKIQKVLKDFKDLGAKSVEITGGGNPLLYRDGKNNINDIVDYAHELGYSVGIITNSHKLNKLTKSSSEKLKWVRVSLIQLDEGIPPEQYDFGEIPYYKLGFSYIIYDPCEESPRKGVPYVGTTSKTIENIAKLVELHPDIKFVRIAGNCLIKGNNQAIKEQYSDILGNIDKFNKIFIKDIGMDDSPYNDGCYVGLLRPYIAPNPEGGDYQVYICTSHVLNTRTYDLDYSLGSVDNIKDIWESCNKRYEKTGIPYEVKSNCGEDWCETCNYCYYKFNNTLLHKVMNRTEDWDFA